MHSPFLYFPHERLSPAELSAARLDGHLVELGEGYIPADAIETATLRAASLRPLLGDRLAASLWSAAWIYGALDDPPARHSVSRAVEHRVTTMIDRRAVFHDLTLGPADIVEIAGILVVSPARTLVDLARRTAGGEEARDAETAVHGLLDAGVVTAAAGLAWLAGRGRMPGVRAATTLLTRLAAQPDVTR